MPTVEASGTLTATLSEDTLAQITLNRSVVLVVDLNAMLGGDVVLLRLKRRVLVAGTTRTMFVDSFTGLQTTAPIVQSAPMASPHLTTATLQQSAGAARSFPWSLESI